MNLVETLARMKTVRRYSRVHQVMVQVHRQLRAVLQVQVHRVRLQLQAVQVGQV